MQGMLVQAWNQYQLYSQWRAEQQHAANTATLPRRKDSGGLHAGGPVELADEDHKRKSHTVIRMQSHQRHSTHPSYDMQKKQSPAVKV